VCPQHRHAADRHGHGYGAVGDAMSNNLKKSPVELQALTTIQQNNFTPKPPLARGPITLTVCVTPCPSSTSRQHCFHQTAPLYIERRIYFRRPLRGESKVQSPKSKVQSPKSGSGEKRACRGRNRGRLPLQFPRFSLAGWKSRCTVEDSGLLLPLGFVPVGSASLHAEHGAANAVCCRIEVHSP